ncbi:hypothetical protein BDV26DRAFT_261527 [Aspergillus bertholletiae]|uniref:Uncharacterized protein n=1 Tax=Aspergillus bertholletiae TaxID=1226010 RepID=A0A5N7B9T2_9EURO|nr:hypothetical protein BDV26DRAFT_261527 [Aspergillus bertholletiae]
MVARPSKSTSLRSTQDLGPVVVCRTNRKCKRGLGFSECFCYDGWTGVFGFFSFPFLLFPVHHYPVADIKN